MAFIHILEQPPSCSPPPMWPISGWRITGDPSNVIGDLCYHIWLLLPSVIWYMQSCKHIFLTRPQGRGAKVKFCINLPCSYYDVCMHHLWQNERHVTVSYVHRHIFHDQLLKPLYYLVVLISSMQLNSSGCYSVQSFVEQTLHNVMDFRGFIVSGSFWVSTLRSKS